jgi:hypothetical protein
MEVRAAALRARTALVVHARDTPALQGEGASRPPPIIIIIIIEGS